jgi:hypothetical protein
MVIFVIHLRDEQKLNKQSLSVKESLDKIIQKLNK